MLDNRIKVTAAEFFSAASVIVVIRSNSFSLLCSIPEITFSTGIELSFQELFNVINVGVFLADLFNITAGSAAFVDIKFPEEWLEGFYSFLRCIRNIAGDNVISSLICASVLKLLPLIIFSALSWKRIV